MGMFDPPRGMFVVDTQDQSSLGGLIADYLRNVMSGKIAAEGVLGQNHYDPNRSFAQNALDPSALSAATDVALSLSGGPIRAYHGSPYDFNKFDISKIGTGEGAQAYGHGLYFAEAEPVARAYRDALSAAQPPGRMYEVNIHADPSTFLNWDKPLSAQPVAVQSALGFEGVIGKPPMDVISATIREARDKGIPLKEYPPYQALQEQNRQANAATFERLGIGNVPGFVPGDLQASAYHTGLGEKLGDPGAVTGYLTERGIPGIKYLDQGSRVNPAAIERQIDMHRQNLASGSAMDAAERQSWESRIAELQAELTKPQTSNYVVFDPKIVEILRKYGILGPVAAPGALIPFMGEQQQ